MGQSFLITPPTGPLRGQVLVPGDKSIAHRLLLLAGLADGRCEIRGLSGGQDNQRTAAALAALGVPVRETGPAQVEVLGQGLAGLRAPVADIDCGNSGTSMRLLCGLLGAQPFPSRLFGDPYLNARPMRRVVDPLSQMGVRVRGQPGKKPGEVYPPLEIEPAPALHGIRYRSPIASAQVKSAILLCGLFADGVTEVEEPLRSRDHTERLLTALGVPLTVSADGLQSRLDPQGWTRRIAPFSAVVPGDFSSAAFLVGAALLLPGSDLLLRGVGLNPTRTGFLDAMEQLCPGAAEQGAEHGALGEPVGELRVRGRETALRGMTLAGALSLRALDELPLCAALAAAAEGDTTIADARELRVKESDRIAASCALLHAFGVECEEREDGLVVRGRGRTGLRPAHVHSHGDHRIAMAGAVLALAAPGPSRIEDVDNVATSFPGFATELVRLGAYLQIL